MNFDLAFQADDYDSINEVHFKHLREGQRPIVDPSGWLDAHSDAAALLPDVRLEPRCLSPYYIDEDDALGEIKERIVALISAWEARSVATDEVTLCHSVSTCTLVMMSALKALGISTIVFETPAYSVTISQAKQLGLRVVRVPTYRRDGFRLPLMEALIRECSPCAVWITQPRMSLGFDQSPGPVRDIAAALSPRDYLVVDEATEQRFPSALRSLSEPRAAPNVLRLRGLLKGVGLNGLRTAFIVHHPSMRKLIQAGQEFAGGSLDVYSLTIAAALSDDIDRFRNMLVVANKQTTDLRARVEKIVYGTRVEASHLVNGYIGCLFVRFSAGSYHEMRRRFLEGCSEQRMPVIVGPSMQFAHDPDLLQIRLNYFNGERNVLSGALGVVEVASTLPDQLLDEHGP